MNSTLLPLTLLEADDEEPIDGITRFQKLVFLVDQEIIDSEELYTFRPDNYGPFSPDLYNDLDWLVENEFSNRTIVESPFGNDTNRYEITPKGRRTLDNARSRGTEIFEYMQKIEIVKKEYNDRNLWDLLEEVYSRYPDMAENSKLNI